MLIDDFALQALDAMDTADISELSVERHRAAAAVVTSNREPIEWLGLIADPGRDGDRGRGGVTVEPRLGRPSHGGPGLK